jgi:glycolate oxidase
VDSFAIEAAEGFANVGYPLDAQALLLCELDGTKAQVQAELESVLKVLSPHEPTQALA